MCWSVLLGDTVDIGFYPYFSIVGEGAESSVDMTESN